MHWAANQIDNTLANHRNIPEGFIPIADRPSEDHVLADNWQDDPMNPDVCWRTKTAGEVETEQEEVAEKEFNNSKLIKAVAIWVAQMNSIPLAQAKQEIKAIYKGL